jgi:hypothetical protein
VVLGVVQGLVQAAGRADRGVQVRGDRGEHGGRVALVLAGDALVTRTRLKRFTAEIS